MWGRKSIAFLWPFVLTATAAWADVPALQRQETGQAPRIGFPEGGIVCVLGSERAAVIAAAWAFDRTAPIQILDCSAPDFQLPHIVSDWPAYWSIVERKLTEQDVDTLSIAGVITVFDVPSGGPDQVSLWTFLLEQVQRHLGRSLPGLQFGAHASLEISCRAGADEPAGTGFYYWEAVTRAIDGEEAWHEGPYLLTEGPGIVRGDGFQVDCLDFSGEPDGRPVSYENALPGQGARKFAREYDAWTWTLFEQTPMRTETASGGTVATVQGRPLDADQETVDTADSGAEPATEPTSDRPPPTSAQAPEVPHSPEPPTPPRYDEAPAPVPISAEPDNAPRNLTASGGPRVTFSWEGPGQLTCDGQAVSQSVWIPEELNFGSHRCVVESPQGTSNAITLVCTASDCSVNTESARERVSSRSRTTVPNGSSVPPSEQSSFIRIEAVSGLRSGLETSTEPVQSGADLVLAQPDDFYTVQIMALASLIRLEAYVRNHALTDTTIARTRVEGKTWYVLLRGFYPTEPLALEASRTLPGTSNGDGVWVRKLKWLKQAVQHAEG